jgi:hypothetical protein
MDNRKLVSALLLLITFSCFTIMGNHALISAQETMPSSTEAIYNVESGTPDAFEDRAKVARDSALELIEEAIERPTEASNTTETASVDFTDEFGGENQNLKGAAQTKDYVEEILNNIIEGSTGNSTSLSFKMKVDTECEPVCGFKVYLQK